MEPSSGLPSRQKGDPLMSEAGGSENPTVDILLVEDNPYDAELTLRVLKQNNLANRLVWVKDGAAALELFFPDPGSGKGRPAPVPMLTLLDLKLPKVDGIEVLRRLKGDPRTKTGPVVVLTSSREDVDILRTYDLGANSYIVKPVDFQKFAEAVRQLSMYWLLLNQPPGVTER
jgi:two-component system response regulator